MASCSQNELQFGLLHHFPPPTSFRAPPQTSPASATTTMKTRPSSMPQLLHPRRFCCPLCFSHVWWCSMVSAMEDVLRRFLFVEGPGLYHQGSTAALKVLSYLPLPYSALSALLVIPTPLRETVYDHVAKRRYDWFGKSEDCLVLKEKELLERFIA
ncbi:hypothetical protein ACLB2K_038862 [Fragaria x ananassa]